MILLIRGRPLGSERVKKTISLNPFTPKSDLIDFTLSNARRFYSSKGDPLGVKGLMAIKHYSHITENRKVLLFSWLNFKHIVFFNLLQFVTCHVNVSFSVRANKALLLLLLLLYK